MRRAIATAAIGVAAAGIIGLASPAASATPVSNGDTAITASCDAYWEKYEYAMDKAYAAAARGDDDAYAYWKAVADENLAAYKACHS